MPKEMPICVPKEETVILTAGEVAATLNKGGEVAYTIPSEMLSRHGRHARMSNAPLNMATPRVLLSTVAAAEMIGVRSRTLILWRARKDFGRLPFLKFGDLKSKGAVRYLLSDVQMFIEQSRVGEHHKEASRETR